MFNNKNLVKGLDQPLIRFFSSINGPVLTTSTTARNRQSVIPFFKVDINGQADHCLYGRQKPWHFGAAFQIISHRSVFSGERPEPINQTRILNAPAIKYEAAVPCPDKSCGYPFPYEKLVIYMLSIWRFYCSLFRSRIPFLSDVIS